LPVDVDSCGNPLRQKPSFIVPPLSLFPVLHGDSPFFKFFYREGALPQGNLVHFPTARRFANPLLFAEASAGLDVLLPFFPRTSPRFTVAAFPSPTSLFSSSRGSGPNDLFLGFFRRSPMDLPKLSFLRSSFGEPLGTERDSKVPFLSHLLLPLHFFSLKTLFFFRDGSDLPPSHFFLNIFLVFFFRKISLRLKFHSISDSPPLSPPSPHLLAVPLPLVPRNPLFLPRRFPQGETSFPATGTFPSPSQGILPVPPSPPSWREFLPRLRYRFPCVRIPFFLKMSSAPIFGRRPWLDKNDSTWFEFSPFFLVTVNPPLLGSPLEEDYL